MDDIIILSQARRMARDGLPGGNFPAWNLRHFDTYGRRLDEILEKGTSGDCVRWKPGMYDPETLVLRHIKN